MDATCEYCHAPFTPNPKARTAQKFCCRNHRVYFHREGGGLIDAPEARAAIGSEPVNSLAGALMVLATIDLPTTAAIRAITVDRVGHYPATWVVTVPPKSATAAEKVRDKLMEAEDDLKTLRRKLEQAIKPTKAPARGRSRA
jgi:hypothetical protein